MTLELKIHLHKIIAKADWDMSFKLAALNVIDTVIDITGPYLDSSISPDDRIHSGPYNDQWRAGVFFRFYSDADLSTKCKFPRYISVEQSRFSLDRIKVFFREEKTTLGTMARPVCYFEINSIDDHEQIKLRLLILLLEGSK